LRELLGGNGLRVVIGVELEKWMEKFVNWRPETELEKMHDNFQVANKIVKTTNEIF
jgi:hypothetical protein